MSNFISKSQKYKELKGYLNSTKDIIIWFTVIEIVLVTVITISSSNLNSNVFKWVLSVSIILYLPLFVLKNYKQIKYPTKIVDDLIATEKLEKTEVLFDRQNHINSYLCQSIQKLNKQTCNIESVKGDDICDNELEKGLQDLLNPILSNTNILYNCNSISFTIGILAKNLYCPESGYNTRDFLSCLKDDLELKSLFSYDLLKDGLVDPKLKISHSFESTLQNNYFQKNTFEYNNLNYYLNCFPVPEICSNDSNGLLFIVHDKEIDLPNDLGSLINIFSRIAINYINAYDNCVISKHLNSKDNNK